MAVLGHNPNDGPHGRVTPMKLDPLEHVRALAAHNVGYQCVDERLRCAIDASEVDYDAAGAAQPWSDGRFANSRRDVFVLRKRPRFSLDRNPLHVNLGCTIFFFLSARIVSPNTLRMRFIRAPKVVVSPRDTSIPTRVPPHSGRSTSLV